MYKNQINKANIKHKFLSLSYTHTHILSLFLSHTHTHTFPLSLTHTCSLSLSLSLPHTHTHTPKTFPKTWFPSSSPKSSKREHLFVALRPTKWHAHLDNFSPATYRFLFLEVVAKLRRTSADRFLICHPRDAEVDEHWIMLGWRKERKRRKALFWRWKKS